MRQTLPFALLFALAACSSSGGGDDVCDPVVRAADDPVVEASVFDAPPECSLQMTSDGAGTSVLESEAEFLEAYTCPAGVADDGGVLDDAGAPAIGARSGVDWAARRLLVVSAENAPDLALDYAVHTEPDDGPTTRVGVSSTSFCSGALMIDFLVIELPADGTRVEVDACLRSSGDDEPCTAP